MMKCAKILLTLSVNGFVVQSPLSQSEFYDGPVDKEDINIEDVVNEIFKFNEEIAKGNEIEVNDRKMNEGEGNICEMNECVFVGIESDNTLMI